VLGVVGKEPLLEDFHLLGGFVHELVGGIAEWWESVDLLSFLCFGQGLDVLGVGCVVELFVCPVAFCLD